MRELRIGTRGSQLALWQANTVARRLTETAGVCCRLVVIKTEGDRIQDEPLSAIGGKRLFVKEIEDALLRGDADIAVHSSKDMPVRPPDGLVVAGVLPREDPRDALVLPWSPERGGPDRQDSHPPSLTFDDALTRLGGAPLIGTGSIRRIAQLAHAFPDGRFASVRGNLDTRLRKLDEGGFDALVLAAAGLRRLGWSSRISTALPVDICVPAPGQGIVAIEGRLDDRTALDAVAAINDRATHTLLNAEWAVVETLGGGCQTPVGVLASADVDGAITIVAAVAAVDGSRVIRGRAHGPAADVTRLGTELGERLRADGADRILQAVGAARPVKTRMED